MTVEKLPALCRVTTNGGTLNIRQTAGGKKIGSVPNGEDVIVDGIVNKWAHVNFEGTIGWCSTQYLKYLAPAEEYEFDEDDGVSILPEPDDENADPESTLWDVVVVVNDLCEASAAVTDQISAIYKALKKAGIMKSLPHYSEGAGV